jgi:hypothetical protein
MKTMRADIAARTARALLIGLALTLMLVAPASAGERALAENMLIPSAGWHGRPIQNPACQHAVRASVKDVPLYGWSAGPVSYGAGYHRPDGSGRVREVQRRLHRLGYRPGPVDGLFGPLTRASVAWFQLKHGLRVDGRATLATVRLLRFRTGIDARSTEPAGQRTAVTQNRRGQTTRPTSITPSAPVLAEHNVDPVSAATAADRPPVVAFMLAMIALGLALFALGLAVAMYSRRKRDAKYTYVPDPDWLHRLSHEGRAGHIRPAEGDTATEADHEGRIRWTRPEEHEAAPNGYASPPDAGDRTHRLLQVTRRERSDA